MTGLEDYQYLEKLALDAGVHSAKVITAKQIVVEGRVRLKCEVGCPVYGKYLKCPPHVPSVDEFRKVLNDYRYAMIVRYKQPEMPPTVLAEVSAMLAPAPGKRLKDLAEANVKASPELRSFFAGQYERNLEIMLELERAAFNHGSPLAVALTAGACRLCEECNVAEGLCRHPTRARIAAEAFGINVVKTAENAGMGLMFSGEKPPGWTMILLID